MLKNLKNCYTVDGKSGSGKSTAAKGLARRLKIPYLSSGLLYRFAAKKLIENKPKNKISFLIKCFSNLNYNKLKKLNLHTSEISAFSATIAKQKKIRLIIKRFQKKFVQKHRNHCVIEGRDSHLIFPKAAVKFFIKCNPYLAALRRFAELKKKKVKISLQQVKKDLRKRDYSDTTRRHSPLTLTTEHLVIRSDRLTKIQMIDKMIKEINRYKN